MSFNKKKKEVAEDLQNNTDVEVDMQNDANAEEVIRNDDKDPNENNVPQGDKSPDVNSLKDEYEKQLKVIDELNNKLNEQNNKIDGLQKSLDEYKDSYQRLLAEFDNYKKRTLKEKESIFSSAKADVLTEFLVIIDNMERAVNTIKETDDIEGIRQGVELVLKQLLDVFKSQGVEEIPALREEFNPELHNAVMHIEDDTCDENVIVEVFVKGYRLKDKVLRHSIVKVAN